jgi:hypothetical protein
MENRKQRRYKKHRGHGNNKERGHKKQRTVYMKQQQKLRIQETKRTQGT